MEQDEGNESLDIVTDTFPQLQEPEMVSEEVMITNICVELYSEKLCLSVFSNRVIYHG
jgi:hypothetical protein